MTVTTVSTTKAGRTATCFRTAEALRTVTAVSITNVIHVSVQRRC